MCYDNDIPRLFAPNKMWNYFNYDYGWWNWIIRSAINSKKMVPRTYQLRQEKKEIQSTHPQLFQGLNWAAVEFHDPETIEAYLGPCQTSMTKLFCENS